jgi:alcohol dehydrogenase class IV
VARPKKSISKMRGQLKILKKTPFFVAIPTTAGTGSETTLAAVITDGETHNKYAINDPSLIPNCAVLDPTLTAKLPPSITASTGMDALVHAVEAYIGGSNTRQTRKDALAATKLIYKYLYAAYLDGENLDAREKMQRAAFMAGAAFTRAYVGNIHAVAHTLGGQYGTPHGLANAVIMPYVLDAYGSAAHRRLSELAQASGIATAAASDRENALAFIASVRELNIKMGISDKLSDLKKEDIPMLATRALKEANPLYPVPKIFDRADMEAIYYLILEDGK